MSEITLLHATFGSAAEAERIARAVVAERLAACANILGGYRSIYRWQGAIETAGEVGALFKTMPDRAIALAERIAGLHGYDLPTIEHWRVAAAEDVVAWVRDGVTNRNT